jgi:hypothetical protein
MAIITAGRDQADANEQGEEGATHGR